MTSPPPSLNYATPLPREGWGRFLWHLLNWYTLYTLIVLALVMVVPRFERVFMDFKVELPTPTKCVLLASRWMSNDFGWLILLPVPLLVAYLLGRPRPAASLPRRSLRTYRAIMLLMLAAFAVTLILALLRPYIALIDGIAQQKR